MTTDTTPTAYPPAGREMDRIIATRLFGVHVEHRELNGAEWYVLAYADGRRVLGSERPNADRVWEHVPNYSTTFTTAWRVWRECIVRFGAVTIAADMEDYGREPGDICWVSIPLGIWAPDDEVEDIGVIVLGDFPYAICKAALLALDWMEQHTGEAQS